MWHVVVWLAWCVPYADYEADYACQQYAYRMGMVLDETPAQEVGVACVMHYER